MTKGHYKCAICSGEISDNQNKIPYKNRYVHEDCFNTLMKASADQKREEQVKKSLQRKNSRKKNTANDSVVVVRETTKNKSPEEIADEKQFTKYILELTGNKPDVKTYTLAKKYTEQYKIKYVDLVTALRYWYEIKENVYEPEKFSLGIVPYVIDEAIKYYSELEKTIEKNLAIDSSEYYRRETVRINNRKRHIGGMVDIAKIGE